MKKYIIQLFFAIIFVSCQKEVQLQLSLPEKPQQGKGIVLNISNLNNTELDKVIIKVDDKVLSEIPYQNKIVFQLDKNYKLGHHRLQFDFQKDGETLKSIAKNIELFAGVHPKRF